jgi:hypothetical protein
MKFEASFALIRANPRAEIVSSNSTVYSPELSVQKQHYTSSEYNITSTVYTAADSYVSILAPSLIFKENPAFFVPSFLLISILCPGTPSPFYPKGKMHSLGPFLFLAERKPCIHWLPLSPWLGGNPALIGFLSLPS